MAGAALVEQQALGQQGAEDAARELGKDVDDRVEGIDPPHGGNRDGHRRVEVAAADPAEDLDHDEEDEAVDEPDDCEVGAELGLVAGRHEQRGDGGDEEDQKERADSSAM